MVLSLEFSKLFVVNPPNKSKLFEFDSKNISLPLTFW
jgi:hypothetical protein